MTSQPNVCANTVVDKLLMKHNNRPMKAFYEALKDTTNKCIEVPMAIIMDRRCGIERRAEEEDALEDLVDATPLMLAINVPGRVDVANALLAAGADPNTKASDGHSSLMAAARKGNLDAIESLISYGADINAVDEFNRTALHVAACWEHTSVIEILEPSGPNLEAVDYEGCTALHSAASTCEAATKALLLLGANQAAVDKYGRTPLLCAGSRKDIRALFILK